MDCRTGQVRTRTFFVGEPVLYHAEHKSGELFVFPREFGNKNCPDQLPSSRTLPRFPTATLSLATARLAE